jgi:pilus assembly protein CpaC
MPTIRDTAPIFPLRAARFTGLMAASAAIALMLLPQPGEAQQRRDRRAEGVEYTTVPSPRMAPSTVDRVNARKIDLGVGKAFVVNLPEDAKEVFVSNPKVANAVVRSARTIYVIGVEAGATTVFAIGGDGQQIAAMEVVVGREIDVLKQLLRTALPNSQVDVKSVGDTIVLTGTVDNMLEAQKAVDIARGFVGTSYVGPQAGGGAGTSFVSGGAVIEGKVINSLTVRARDQVMLKVTIVEVQRTILKQLGVDLTGNWEIAGKSFFLNNFNPFTASTEAGAFAQALGGRVGTVGGLSQREMNLKAFERQGVMRVLAEPTVTAVSGETAKFLAGGEIPVPRQVTLSGGVPSVQLELRPYGVQLVFTPIVLSEGRISLRVASEVTEVDPSLGSNAGRAGSAQYVVPGFRVRRQDTTVELPSGGSLVAAGLIQTTSKSAINGLPGLINLPILGTLFRSRDYQRQETELMMIVTPFIAKPSAAAALARPDDGLVDASDPSANLMGRLNRIYGVAGARTSPGGYNGRFGFIHD